MIISEGRFFDKTPLAILWHFVISCGASIFSKQTN